jgi:hypothetical protein
LRIFNGEASINSSAIDGRYLNYSGLIAIVARFYLSRACVPKFNLGDVTVSKWGLSIVNTELLIYLDEREMMDLDSFIFMDSSPSQLQDFHAPLCQHTIV